MVRTSRVRALFEAIDRSIESGEWTEPPFDDLLRELEGAISEAYGPQSRGEMAPASSPGSPSKKSE